MLRCWSFFLCSNQFFDRIKLFGMPAKHQPDLIYLRYVPLWKVHAFTIVQLTCLVLLWVIKASAAAVIFPMMVNLQTFLWGMSAVSCPGAKLSVTFPGGSHCSYFLEELVGSLLVLFFQPRTRPFLPNWVLSQKKNRKVLISESKFLITMLVQLSSSSLFQVASV